MAKYILEVYEPGGADTVAFSIQSEKPFSAISKGDLLHHQTMNMHHRLRVVEIQHLFWESPEGLAQKTCVQTEAAHL
ncbi:hypothetical protein [Consotaella aegiceratis]|uniref:hypothetical protein n=1 Tax=Consotaella aegiceratis TaxID=3097961 RepID=UPI002F3EB009